jgi:hypothetical protein
VFSECILRRSFFWYTLCLKNLPRLVCPHTISLFFCPAFLAHMAAASDALLGSSKKRPLVEEDDDECLVWDKDKLMRGKGSVRGPLVSECEGSIPSALANFRWRLFVWKGKPCLVCAHVYCGAHGQCPVYASFMDVAGNSIVYRLGASDKFVIGLTLAVDTARYIEEHSGELLNIVQVVALPEEAAKRGLCDPSYPVPCIIEYPVDSNPWRARLQVKQKSTLPLSTAMPHAGWGRSGCRAVLVVTIGKPGDIVEVINSNPFWVKCKPCGARHDGDLEDDATDSISAATAGPGAAAADCSPGAVFITAMEACRDAADTAKRVLTEHQAALATLTRSTQELQDKMVRLKQELADKEAEMAVAAAAVVVATDDEDSARSRLHKALQRLQEHQ